MLKMKVIILCCFVYMFAIGCTYSHNVNVYMSPELKTHYGYYPSLEVDLIGMNDSEKNWIESYDTDKYFEADNPLRKSLSPFTMKFSESDYGVQYLSRGSKLWNKWKDKGAKELYIIVNLPETHLGKSSSKMLSFKIKSNIFKSHDKHIEIKPAGILLLPSPPAGDYGERRKADAL